MSRVINYLTDPLKKKPAVPIGAKHPLHKQEKDFLGSRFWVHIKFDGRHTFIRMAAIDRFQRH